MLLIPPNKALSEHEKNKEQQNQQGHGAAQSMGCRVKLSNILM